MREEIIVSGRNNYLIDPHLHIWHWQIPLYLFLGGLAAGILFFASLYTLMGKEEGISDSCEDCSAHRTLAAGTGTFRPVP
jgi:formate-dependent nitrite reductase membrane component NrfD